MAPELEYVTHMYSFGLMHHAFQMSIYEDYFMRDIAEVLRKRESQLDFAGI